DEMVCLLPRCCFRPGRRLGIAPGKEMSQRGGGLDVEDIGIIRAQPHGASQVLNRTLRLTKPDLNPAAEEPRHRQIRIELKSPIDQGSAIVELAATPRERKPGPAERDGIIPPQL